VANTIAFQALQDLVTQKLIIQMARDKGFKLDDTAVQAEIATLEKINPGYVKNLQARGLTMEQIRQSIRVDLAQEHLLTEGIKISDQQVDKFIKDSPNAFLKPAMAEVVQIVVRDERSKQRADNLLSQGRNFTDVAREVNPQNVPSRSELNLTAMKAQVAAPVVRTLYTGLTTTAPGRATAWIKLADNEQVKYLVERRTQESKIEITKERRERIRRDLAKAQGAQAVDLNDRIAKRLKDSTVTVDKSYLKGMWERFMETFGEALKEQEAKTGTTAGN
jgi:foldase protein PrsA